MNSKQTGTLKVLADAMLTDAELVINPNDGFDLGLMMTETPVELILNNNREQISITKEGVLIQKNNCTLGTVIVGSRLVEKLENSTSVYLHIEEQDKPPKLLINLK